MKILYLEDNAVNLSLIERIAQMNKHELLSFEEAEPALEVLAKGETFDLILLDIQLAGEMDGIEFAKAVRQKGFKTPIIAITAYAMIGDKERILEAGCNDYLPKPLPIAEFLALLAKYDSKLSEEPIKEEKKEPAKKAVATTSLKQEEPTKETTTTASSKQEEPTKETTTTTASSKQEEPAKETTTTTASSKQEEPAKETTTPKTEVNKDQATNFSSTDQKVKTTNTKT